jgi:ATP-dependent Clp protease ATP-binding subunit ClpC
MFERFTDRARRVVVLAQEEARLLDHNYIGTEHILLGLIHEGEGAAAKALESLGVGLQPVREQVEKMIGRGKKQPSGHIPFTPRAKKVLELSLREALELGHNYIGSEHILLGLLREGEGVAVQIIVRLGADLHQLRQQVIQMLRNEGTEAGPAPRVAVATPVEDVSFPTRQAARELWLTEFQNSLNKIVDRLDAIERHLGLKRAPADSPGGTQAAASGGAEADAPAHPEEPSSPEVQAPGGSGTGESSGPEAEAQARGPEESSGPEARAAGE